MAPSRFRAWFPSPKPSRSRRGSRQRVAPGAWGRPLGSRTRSRTSVPSIVVVAESIARFPVGACRACRSSSRRVPVIEASSSRARSRSARTGTSAAPRRCGTGPLALKVRNRRRRRSTRSRRTRSRRSVSSRSTRARSGSRQPRTTPPRGGGGQAARPRRPRLMAIPGIAPWTAAPGARPDARSTRRRPRGRFPSPEPRDPRARRRGSGDDRRMLELLEPFRPHRWRVVRLLSRAGRAGRAVRRWHRFAPCPTPEGSYSVGGAHMLLFLLAACSDDGGVNIFRSRTTSISGPARGGDRGRPEDLPALDPASSPRVRKAEAIRDSISRATRRSRRPVRVGAPHLDDPSAQRVLRARWYIYVYTGIIEFLDHEGPPRGRHGPRYGPRGGAPFDGALTEIYGIQTLLSFVLGKRLGRPRVQIASSLVSLQFSRNDEPKPTRTPWSTSARRDYAADGAAGFFQKLIELERKGALRNSSRRTRTPKHARRRHRGHGGRAGCNTKPGTTTAPRSASSRRGCRRTYQPNGPPVFPMSERVPSASGTGTSRRRWPGSSRRASSHRSRRPRTTDRRRCSHWLRPVSRCPPSADVAPEEAVPIESTPPESTSANGPAVRRRSCCRSRWHRPRRRSHRAGCRPLSRCGRERPRVDVEAAPVLLATLSTSRTFCIGPASRRSPSPRRPAISGSYRTRRRPGPCCPSWSRRARRHRTDRCRPRARPALCCFVVSKRENR